jgi:hypothetical protein
MALTPDVANDHVGLDKVEIILVLLPLELELVASGESTQLADSERDESGQARLIWKAKKYRL